MPKTFDVVGYVGDGYILCSECAHAEAEAALKEAGHEIVEPAPEDLWGWSYDEELMEWYSKRVEEEYGSELSAFFYSDACEWLDGSRLAEIRDWSADVPKIIGWEIEVDYPTCDYCSQPVGVSWDEIENARDNLKLELCRKEREWLIERCEAEKRLIEGLVLTDSWDRQAGENQKMLDRYARLVHVIDRVRVQLADVYPSYIY